MLVALRTLLDAPSSLYSLEVAKECVQLLYSMSVVGLDTSFEEEQLNTGDEIFMITALENRVDPSYADETSMSYRDLAMNIEVGWLPTPLSDQSHPY